MSVQISPLATPFPERIRTTPSVTFTGISWQTYSGLLRDLGKERGCRIADDQGVLEIRMPLTEHKEPKGLIESFIEAIADILEIEIQKLRALTLE
ncbi:MAG: hypothetical protein ACOC0N_09670 [Chroococcales cyanobacterium]